MAGCQRLRAGSYEVGRPLHCSHVTQGVRPSEVVVSANVEPCCSEACACSRTGQAKSRWLQCGHCCAQIFPSRVDIVFSWGGSYHLRW
jgi:hypothetical protein